MGPAVADLTVQDTSLDLSGYLKVGTDHMVIGEIASKIRAGKAASLQVPQNLTFQSSSGDSFALGAAPGPDTQSAILFGMHLEGTNFGSDHKNFYSGLVHQNEFANLAQSPLPFMKNQYGSNGLNEMARYPSAFGEYIALTHDYGPSDRVGLTVFDRDGAVGRINEFVFSAGNVNRSRATVLSETEARFLVTWVETAGGTSTLRGLRMQCE
jgi:hypothetical protein